MRFDDIVQPLVRVVAETVTGPDRDLRLAVEGDAGMLPGDLATPLAVVLNELMQNAVDHAFPEGAGEALVEHIKPLARTTDRPGVMGGLGGFGLSNSLQADAAAGTQLEPGFDHLDTAKLVKQLPWG